MVNDSGRRELDETEGADALGRGEVVALPTDTVYGLAVRADAPRASRMLFALKQRPEGVALAVLVADLEQARALVADDDRDALDALGEAFWPGPVTFVARRADGARLELGGDPSTIGVRCPDHALVRSLCRALGPLIVTSANRHGDAPCTTVDEVRASIGASITVVDGGRCARKPSSVIVLPDGPRLLRAGPVSLASVLAVLEHAGS